MRSALLLSVLAGLVAGSPIANPQGIDFDGYDVSLQNCALCVPLRPLNTHGIFYQAGATPVPKAPVVGAVSPPVSYDPGAAAASASVDATASPVATPTGISDARRDVYHFDARGVNDPCGKQPPGSGTVPTPDTVDAFMSYGPYAAIASDAPTPQGYTLVQNLDGAPYQNGFMSLYTLKSYDTIKCQSYCDQADGCVAFNMAIERNPSVAPADACPNPPSTINYKCTLWGLPISAATAKNKGQWRSACHVVVTASNGYVKMAPPDPIDGFTGPVKLSGAINAPSSYIGMKYYAGPYDPCLCAATCHATTAYDKKHASTSGKYDACNLFNSYVLSIDNVPQGTYCSMYTKPWEKKYSTNYGQYRGKRFYSVSQSYAYTFDPQDPAQTMSAPATENNGAAPASGDAPAGVATAGTQEIRGSGNGRWVSVVA